MIGLAKNRKRELILLLTTVAYLAFFYLQNGQTPYMEDKVNRVHVVHYIYYPVLYEQKTDLGLEITSEEEEQQDILHQVDRFASKTGEEAVQATVREYQAQRRKEVAAKATRSSKSSTVSPGKPQLLLSGQGVVRALSKLSWKDRLWLAGILSRCSLKELMAIRDMLQGGVTREENREMYLMLRNKISDEEQNKLDRLIEIYTRD